MATAADLPVPARAPRVRLPRTLLRGAGDERLVEHVRAGDRVAFEVLYDRHHRGVLAFCRHMLGGADEAEDAVQHTFVAAYRALLADDREIQLKAWLYTIARNRCLSVLRARRDQVALDHVEPLLPATRGLAAEVQERDDLKALLADLQRLPEAQRAALVLAELGAHSHDEIATVLGVRPAKVKALIFQAREALMMRREAREADCGEVREQLSVLRGSALRRGGLRRHVEQCPGCSTFEAEVRRQRAGLAAVLPVAPTVALKQSSLAAAFGTAGGAGAAGVAATGLAGGSAGLAGGSAAVGAGVKALGVKALVALAVAGGAGGTGYVAVERIADDPPGTPAPAASPSAASGGAPPAAPFSVPAGDDDGDGRRPDAAQRPRRSDERGAAEGAEDGRGRGRRSTGEDGPAGDRRGRRGRSSGDANGERRGRGRGRGRSGGDRGERRVDSDRRQRRGTKPRRPAEAPRDDRALHDRDSRAGSAPAAAPAAPAPDAPAQPLDAGAGADDGGVDPSGGTRP